MVSRRTFLKAAGGIGAWAVVPKPMRDLATHVSPPPIASTPAETRRYGPPWTAPDRYALRSVSVTRARHNQEETSGVVALSTRKHTLATWQVNTRAGIRHDFHEPIVLEEGEQLYVVSNLRPVVTTLRFTNGALVTYAQP